MANDSAISRQERPCARSVAILAASTILRVVQMQIEEAAQDQRPAMRKAILLALMLLGALPACAQSNLPLSTGY
jgi:hypothetical protein